MEKLEWIEHKIQEDMRYVLYCYTDIASFGEMSIYLEIKYDSWCEEYILFFAGHILEGFTTLKQAQVAAQKYYNQFLKDMKNADN